MEKSRGIREPNLGKLSIVVLVFKRKKKARLAYEVMTQFAYCVFKNDSEGCSQEENKNVFSIYWDKHRAQAGSYKEVAISLFRLGGSGVSYGSAASCKAQGTLCDCRHAPVPCGAGEVD